MTYTRPAFKTKKALKAAIEARENVYAYEPGLGALPKGGGRVFIEGPEYPQPHRWYAEAIVDANGKILRVK